MTDVSSEFGAFISVIARAIVRSHYGMAGGNPTELSDADISPNTGDFQLAYDVLRSPEMQVIGRALHSMAPGGPNDDSACQEGTWDWRSLPPHVQSWAADTSTSPTPREDHPPCTS